MKHDKSESYTQIRHDNDGWHAESNRTGDILQFYRKGWTVLENRYGVKFFAPCDALTSPSVNQHTKMNDAKKHKG